MLTALRLVLAQSDSYCPSPQDKVHVELVTGKVYTAPEDMLDSRPGTLMLTDCIDLCLSNSSCSAANFETGLCVLFSSSADDNKGELTKSQYPVFTIYVQKNCLPSAPSCSAAWSFERVMDHELDTEVSSELRARGRSNKQCVSDPQERTGWVQTGVHGALSQGG